MNIWVDADACPNVIKSILYKAAKRTEVHCHFVANTHLVIPSSKFLHLLQVDKGFDIADNKIVTMIKTGDLVITSDIPLAAEVIASGALALSPRGELYTSENIRGRLNMRDFMDTLRASGIHSNNTPGIGAAEKQRFAAALDSILQKANRS